MAQWRVWNRHPMKYTHKEKFKERIVEIKADEYVLMDYEEAVQFKGQYWPMKKNAQGADDPVGFKVIELERHDVKQDNTPTLKTEFICHFDGAKFPSQALLDAYVKANYEDKIVVDETAEEELKTKRTSKPTNTVKEKTA